MAYSYYPRFFLQFSVSENFAFKFAASENSKMKFALCNFGFQVKSKAKPCKDNNSECSHLSCIYAFVQFMLTNNS